MCDETGELPDIRNGRFNCDQPPQVRHKVFILQCSSKCLEVNGAPKPGTEKNNASVVVSRRAETGYAGQLENPSADRPAKGDDGDSGLSLHSKILGGRAP